MKLTTKGRYAVTALTDMAAHQGQVPIALSEISIRQDISLAYLEQLFSKLRRAGLVTSARGVAGGYSLARDARDIRVAEIVSAVDEQIKTTACNPEGDKGCSGGTARCLTHDLWDELGRQIEVFLSAATLEDIVERRILGMASVKAPQRPLAGGSPDNSNQIADTKVTELTSEAST